MKTHTSTNRKMVQLVHRIWLYKPLLLSCLILLMLAFSFGSCQKKADENVVIQYGAKIDTTRINNHHTLNLPLQTTARVVKGDGELIAGGIPWYLQVSNTEKLYPTALPLKFQLPNIWVNVTYYTTDIPLPADLGRGKFKIRIVEIEKTNEPLP